MAFTCISRRAVTEVSSILCACVLQATLGASAGSASVAFTYFRKIYEMVTAGGQVVPQQSLTMTGTGFGVADYTSHVRIGEYGCEAAAWASVYV